ncbi:MAG: copper chaperone PCu(A)C [Burkholderiales bacterium]|nr:copper chaperone PCu(A)C [Burkholderiales bacterium]
MARAARLALALVVMGAALLPAHAADNAPAPAAASASARAATIVVRHAWMRPAPAGAPSARVYVDIDSDTDLDLVGATTPAARRVEIVRTATIGDPASEEVVPAYRVRAHATTRLAYRGDHLRLVDVTRAARNGEPVPLELEFRDGAGRRVTAPVEVSVRGLLRPEQMPGSAARGAASR